MASRWRDPIELETALRDLGTRLAYPPSEHVAFAVRQQLERAPVPARRRPRWPALRARKVLRPVFGPAWQRVAVALVLLVAIVSGVLTFSPATRKAVAGWLGLRGVKIKVTPGPSLSPVPLGRNLVLGVPVSLAEAQASVPFRILVPSAPGLAIPDEVDLLETLETGQVTLLYRARPGLPAATETGVGLLLTEFQAKPNAVFIRKTVSGTGSTLESVTVRGEPGFWIAGAPHELFYVGIDGEPLDQTVRLSGNVLLWQRGSVTLRIEGEFTKDQALAIAESVR